MISSSILYYHSPGGPRRHPGERREQADAHDDARRPAQRAPEESGLREGRA